MTGKKNITDDIHDIRKHAEEIAAKRAADLSESKHEFSLAKMKQAMHELEVHQIELELQNEELRRTQVERDATQACYFELYDLAPIGYWTITEQGIITQANLTIATLLSETRSTLIKQSITKYIFQQDQDIYYLHRKQLYETGQSQLCELRMVKKDGTVFWAELTARYAQEPSGAAVCNIMVSDISIRKADAEKINNLLTEKELILKEVHHRIKNNMSTIFYLLSMQVDTMTDQLAIDALKDAGGRVQSMMVLYSKLYLTDDCTELSVREYLTALTDEIVGIFPGGDSVKIVMELDDFVLGIQKLAPLGLLLNELLTNMMKHAFKGVENKTIMITAALKNKRASFVFADNGVGIPASVDFTDSTGFGMQLVGMLAEQLGGTITIQREGGTQFVLEFDGS